MTGIIHHSGEKITVCHGDSLEVLRELPDDSLDAVVTDPPYALSFMGKDWDSLHPDPKIWEQCFRVLKPGGHLLSFGGTRTWHRLTCDIEDAGFEIRDNIAWLYGSGFPKSMDVSKAIDKAAGAEREIVGQIDRLDQASKPCHRMGYSGPMRPQENALDITAPATDAAKQWQGWGTALKPAFEPIVVARKPIRGTVAANVQTHGTGALNIDACRVNPGDPVPGGGNGKANASNTLGGGPDYRGTRPVVESHTAGRWPTNVVMDEHFEPVIRLRDSIPSEVDRLIREFFGASTDHLRAVRGTDDGVTESSGPETVLPESVLQRVDVGEPSGRECTQVGQGTHPGISAENVVYQEGTESCRPEEPAVERRDAPGQGICHGQDCGTPSRGSDAGCVDGEKESDARGPHSTASADGGEDAGSLSDQRRMRSSYQWSEGRQSSRESGDSLECGTSTESRRSGSGTLQAQSRELHIAGDALEILRRDCPAGWLHYFDVVGQRREGAAAAVLDEQSGIQKDGVAVNRNRVVGSPKSAGVYAGGHAVTAADAGYGGGGGASRFFPTFKYQAKAPKKERPNVDGVAHPTVKPVELMRWLVRLVTPPNGWVLDPFAGSGTTGEAAVLEGMNCILIEKQDEYLPLIMERVRRVEE